MYVPGGRIIPMRTRAFTLIETVVTIAIFAVVLFSVTSLIIYFYRMNSFVLEQTSAVENSSIGVTDAMKDLREASYGANGAYPVVSASDNSITFYVDMKDDGVVDRVRYWLSGTTLYRGITVPIGNPLSYVGQPEATTSIATDVHNGSTPLFRYFNSSGIQMAPPINVTDIASVNTTVTVNINPNRAPNNFTLSVGATLRNLRRAP